MRLSRTGPSRARPAGFTLVELLITASVLVIVLGLMVSLSRYVRSTSATDVTRDLLRTFGESVSLYWQSSGQIPPDVPPLLAEDKPPSDSDDLQAAAIANNRRLVQVLRQSGVFPAAAIKDLPGSLFRDGILRDAWGSPLVLMPRFNPAIGMALDDRPFLFSAGPDRDYLTREDNLYSYEQVEADPPIFGPTSNPVPATTRPAAIGSVAVPEPAASTRAEGSTAQPPPAEPATAREPVSSGEPPGL